MIELFKGDITTISTDAIVNAANSSLLSGSGVDGAIHRKGGEQILEDCMAIRAKQGGCKTGEAVYTRAGNLKATYVIHTVGPFWSGGNNNEAELLKNCYLNSLLLADSLQVKEIAFPNISTGIYKFPKDKAAAIAIRTIRENIGNTQIEKVLFVCFSEDNYQIYKEKI